MPALRSSRGFIVFWIYLTGRADVRLLIASCRRRQHPDLDLTSFVIVVWSAKRPLCLTPQRSISGCCCGFRLRRYETYTDYLIPFRRNPIAEVACRDLQRPFLRPFRM